MPSRNDRITLVDGSVDFSGGVNSYLTTTIASERNPNGLARNQVSWMDNATVRGGGITQRSGWQKRGNFPDGAIGLYQGKFMYEPDSENPYEVVAVGGHLWKMDVDNPSAAVDLSSQFGVSLPSNLDRYYFAQAEQFLVVQPGDLTHLPLFWDGATLRKSLGLSGIGIDLAPYGDGTNVYGVFGFTSSAAPGIFPPVGSNLIVATTDTSHVGAVGTLLFTLSGYTTNAGQSAVTSYAAVTSSWQIVNVIPNTSVEMKLLGASVAGYAVNVSWWTLTNPPSQFVAGTPEIPPAQSMDYFMGRLWYAQLRQFAAGDIVFGSSGTQQYAFRDSVLKVTENPLAIGGDGFSVPTNSGNIRAIRHSANVNTQLGQGQLFIFTRKSIYSISVPVSRLDWTKAGNATSGNTDMPLMTVVQITNGSVNDRSIAAQNGDLFFQSFEPAVRSLITAVRNFSEWGNVPISINENRILQFDDRSLLQFSSGVSFDNRVLETALPMLTPVGTAHKAIIPLNFDVISTLERKLPPVWEGMWEGLNVLELDAGDFGGRQRCFATTWSDVDRHLQLWEITNAEKFDSPDNRVVWYVEFPSYTWGDEFQMKKLVSAEIWLDRIFGEVNFTLDYRPDCDPCWYPWNKWKLCTARNSCEDVHQPNCLYPTGFGESFRQTISMPLPPNVCQSIMNRPANVGFQFQPRLAIKGFCRIRGILLKAEKVDQEMYSDMVCP